MLLCSVSGMFKAIQGGDSTKYLAEEGMTPHNPSTEKASALKIRSKRGKDLGQSDRASTVPHTQYTCWTPRVNKGTHKKQVKLLSLDLAPQPA
mmetsp:Transcript_60950/g.100877  ORF Transcript_60950/g.100877 Transcript_60950/m.100877 type:complete len:93 (-) Transcript_60950:1014-1292(-)